jgi:hypothetical protein
VGLAIIFYCPRFETSIVIASYDSKGYGGGIRPLDETERLVQSAYKRSECSDSSVLGRRQPRGFCRRPVKTWCVIRRFSHSVTFNSVTRRRLVMAEDPSACVTVSYRLCKSAIAFHLNVIKRTCDQGGNKSYHPN